MEETFEGAVDDGIDKELSSGVRPKKRFRDNSSQSDDSFNIGCESGSGENRESERVPEGEVMHQILTEMKGIRSEISEMKKELREEMVELKRQLRKEVSDLVSKEMHDINVRFEGMVDNVRKEVKTEFAGFEKHLRDMSVKLEKSEVDFGIAKNELKSHVTDFRSEVKCIKGDVDKKLNELNSKLNNFSKREKELVRKSIDIESRSRRNNLLFHGIPEEVGENCEKLVESFIKTELKINQSVVIQRCHRLGRPLPRNIIRKRAGQPRPIIVNLLDFKQREAIRAARNQLKYPFGVSEDFPLEVRKARDSLMPQLKELRQKNKKCSIIWPARLLCEGEIVQEVDVTNYCK